MRKLLASQGLCTIKLLYRKRDWSKGKYKVVQTWPGLFVCKQVTVCPSHIWTTLYNSETRWNNCRSQISTILYNPNQQTEVTSLTNTEDWLLNPSKVTFSDTTSVKSSWVAHCSLSRMSRENCSVDWVPVNLRSVPVRTFLHTIYLTNESTEAIPNKSDG
jgi:hypothetical protein